MNFREGQFVRHKDTDKIGVIVKYADPPWDVYVVVKFSDGTGGYHLESEFERTRKIPRFVLHLTQKINKRM